MRECWDHIPQNQQSNLNGLIKGDLEKTVDLKRTVNTDDIIMERFTVHAGSVNELLRVIEQIECKLEFIQIPLNKRINFVIALVEAINNAQKHGFQFAPDKIVAINLFKIGDYFIIAGIESMGDPIPLGKINMLLNENDPLKMGERSGRGYIIMKNSVDVLYVSHYQFNTEVFLGILLEKDKQN
jgi:anti-sigma regulatory factor (Ser/Thr protein kinase)